MSRIFFPDYIEELQIYNPALKWSDSTTLKVRHVKDDIEVKD